MFDLFIIRDENCEWQWLTWSTSHARHDMTSFINSSLESSDVVQEEDMFLCENVQIGLESPSYDMGR